jgi:hypothetical protein
MIATFAPSPPAASLHGGKTRVSCAANVAHNKRALVGIIAGGILTLLGPIAGFIATTMSMHGAFDSVRGGTVAPEDKAQQLAGGISTAMDYTIAGVVVGAIGVAMLMISAILFLRTKSAS